LCPFGQVSANSSFTIRIVLLDKKSKMKPTIISVLSTCVVIVAFVIIALISRGKIPPKTRPGKAGGRGFAVVELFTSEGCSSCPPADQLIGKIQNESQGKPIYILAYHVDYWNRLGWADVFSDHEYSKRQIQYEKWLKITSIYTPQVIINGSSEFVGSDESAIRSAIQGELDKELNISYQAGIELKGNILSLVLVEKFAKSKVQKGENAGRTLAHVQIVRKLQMELLTGSETRKTIIELPPGLNNQNCEVLGLIQSSKNGQMLAAAKADIRLAEVVSKDMLDEPNN
jgi:hypothetical protein